MIALIPYLRLFKRHGWIMLLGFVLTLVSLIAAMGLLSLSGWFLSAAAVAGLSATTAMAFNFFTPAAGVRFFSLARTASRYGERLATHEATFSLLADLRVWVWRKLLPLGPRELHTMRRGDLLNRLVADIDTLDHLYLRLITPMMASLCMIVGLYFFVAWFQPTLALGLSGFLLLVWLVLPWGFYQLGKRAGNALPEAKQQCRVQLLDIIQGQAELALFDANERYLEQFYQTEAQLYDCQQAQAKVAGMSQGAIVFCNGIALILMLLLASLAMSPSGGFEPLGDIDAVLDSSLSGPVVALLVFTAMASIEMMQPIALAFHQLSACIASAKRLNSLVEQTPSVVFAESAQTVINNSSQAFSFQGITFGYDSAYPILSECHISVPIGANVALLGPTGCGKSSLVALLTRSYAPQCGSIMLNGQKIEDYDEPSLRASMSVMSQRVDIFSASIRDNLSLAMRDISETSAEAISTQTQSTQAGRDSRMIKVLNQVGLGNLLQGDDPLSAWLGEGGRPLSGGEQRRIGVARVLLHDAPLVLLDEPTEGLDRETELEILRLLFDFSKHKTLFMISHRLTAMAQMDVIYRMDSGRLQEVSGSR